MKKCEICGETFEKHSLYANHVRWKHKKPSTENLSKAMIKNLEKRFGKWIIETVKCFHCDNLIEIKYREGNKKEKYFCSRSCANKRNHSKETKEKISKTTLKNWENDEFREKTLKQFQTDNNKRFSSKGEREIREKLKIVFGDNVLAHRNIKLNENLSKAVDIQIKEQNVIIEYDGIWHFKKVKEEHNFELQQMKDKLLNEYCIKNKIKLIRIKEDVYFSDKENIFLQLLSLINKKEINNYFIY